MIDIGNCVAAVTIGRSCSDSVSDNKEILTVLGAGEHNWGKLGAERDVLMC